MISKCYLKLILIKKYFNYFWMIASKSEEICNINTWNWVCRDTHRLLGKFFVVRSFEIPKF